MNKFHFLDVEEETEPPVVAAPVQDKEKAPKAATKGPKAAQPQTQTQSTPNANNNAANNPNRMRTAPVTATAPTQTERAPEPTNEDRPNGPRTGPRSAGGAVRGARGGSRPQKHEQDRQSVVHREGEKSQTNGPGGWGKAGDEEKAEVEQVDTPVTPAVQTTEEQAAAALAQEEAKKMTLEEYKALQASKENVRALPKLREANEGSDDKSFAKKAVPLEKEEEVFFCGQGKEERKRACQQKGRTQRTRETCF